MSRCWWMWTTVPSAGSGLRPIAWSRGFRGAPSSGLHGGGLSWTPGSLAYEPNAGPSCTPLPLGCVDVAGPILGGDDFEPPPPPQPASRTTQRAGTIVRFTRHSLRAYCWPVSRRALALVLLALAPAASAAAADPGRWKLADAVS